jgi:uncharacterized membrane protein YqjE
MSSELTRHIRKFLNVLQKLAKTRIDLLKLTLIEKSSGFASFIFSSLFAVLVAALTVGFGAAAFAVWYGETYNNYVTGLIISAVVLLVIALIFFFIGRKLLTSVIIKNLSEILFEEEEDTES